METRVLETRALPNGIITRRRHSCQSCGHSFRTIEIYDDLWGSIKRWGLSTHLEAVRRRWDRFRRNQLIKQRLQDGVAQNVVAAEFGLSPTMITTLARKFGFASRQKKRPCD